MKRIIETALFVFGIICFVCICSEPAEDTTTKSWLVWELSWWLALAADIAACWLLDKRNIINLHGNGRA